MPSEEEFINWLKYPDSNCNIYQNYYGFPWNINLNEKDHSFPRSPRWEALYGKENRSAIGPGFQPLLLRSGIDSDKADGWTITSLLVKLTNSSTDSGELVHLGQLLEERLQFKQSNCPNAKKRRRMDLRDVAAIAESPLLEISIALGSISPSNVESLLSKENLLSQKVIQSLRIKDVLSIDNDSHGTALAKLCTSYIADDQFWLEAVERNLFRSFSSKNCTLKDCIERVDEFLDVVGYRYEIVSSCMRKMVEFSLSSEVDCDIRSKVANCLEATVRKAPLNFPMLHQFLRGALDYMESQEVLIIKPLLTALWISVTSDCCLNGITPGFDEWCMLTKKYLMSGSILQIKIGYCSSLGFSLALSSLDEGLAEADEGCSQFSQPRKRPSIITMSQQQELINKCVLGSLGACPESSEVLCSLLSCVEGISESLNLDFLVDFCLDQIESILFDDSTHERMRGKLDSLVAIAIISTRDRVSEIQKLVTAKLDPAKFADLESLSAAMKFKHLLLSRFYRFDFSNEQAKELEILDSYRLRISQQISEGLSKSAKALPDAKISRADESQARFLQKVSESSLNSRILSSNDTEASSKFPNSLVKITGSLNHNATIFFLHKSMPWNQGYLSVFCWISFF